MQARIALSSLIALAALAIMVAPVTISFSAL